MKTNDRAVVLPATVRFAFIVGLLFLIEGVCELFQPVVFGVFTTNPLHGLLHLIFALLAIAAGRSGHTRARGFLIFLGGFMLSAGVLWYAESTKLVMTHLLNMNRSAAYVHVFLGVLSLLVVFSSPRPGN